MRKCLFASALVLTSTNGVGADYLPFNHRGPGFGVCRSFISLPGRGHVPHWSQIFPTSASGYDLIIPFEAFIKSNYGNAGQIFSGTCFKTATQADAQALKNDSMYAKVAISTGWIPNASIGQAADPGTPAPKVRPSRVVAISPPPAPKGPTPNQLKYQRELQAHRDRLAEIEQIKQQTAAKHHADRAAAEQQLAAYRQQLATADIAQRRYRAELSQHQALVKQMETAADREQKVDWREAVVVCTLNSNNPQSRFGNWRCDGPLQFTYAKLGGAGTGVGGPALVALSQACGGKPESVRDLGVAGANRLFGCSFGLHPSSKSAFPLDAAAKYGISYVPGRATYRCPAWKSACRTQ